ncbi:MAG: ABC transporter permease [Synergistaceae bacterium]|jgi:peptide/nickel transport system permease protein|nr:ABC transporter permease [Synergistaceae bacterium]
MGKYILKRILIVFPTLLAIIFIVFAVMSLTPNNPAAVMLGPRASAEAVEKLNHELGYDKPLFIRYADYVANLLRGDMGKSYNSRRDVFLEITSRFPTTVKLAASAIFLAVAIGVPLGVIAAVKQYSVFDVIGTAISMFMASMPGFWFGMMAILLFSLTLGWLPSYGSKTAAHFILPSVTLAIPVAATILRFTRTTMLETIRQDYVRTARSKGQTESRVITAHALKNALLPIVTVAGMEFGWLLGGAVVIETLFSINGVGKLIIDSIHKKDIPQVTGCALFLAFFFMLVMLAVDILYAFIDPRIKARYQKG